MMERITFDANPQSREDAIRQIDRIANFPFLTFATLRLCVFALIFLTSFATTQAQIAVRGETVWTMAGAPITNGVVLINNGKIEFKLGNPEYPGQQYWTYRKTRQ